MDQGKPIKWITLINNGYVHFTKNFLKSMEINKVSFHLTIFCLDDESMVALQGIPNVTILSAMPFMKRRMNKNLTVWKSMDYKKIVFAKLDAIKYSLEKFNDSYIGYIDTDIIVFKDPTETMHNAMRDNPAAVIISQCDEAELECSNINKCPNICSGVILFKQCNIINTILEYIDQDMIGYLTDQHYLTAQLKKYNVSYMTINRNIFLNGMYPGVKDNETKLVIPNSAVLLHYNFMIGSYKQRFMIQNNMWYIGGVLPNILATINIPNKINILNRYSQGSLPLR